MRGESVRRLRRRSSLRRDLTILGLMVATGCAGIFTPLVLARTAPAAGAGVGLHVVPFPNTPDASPQSQIILSSLRPSEVQRVRVTGSATGLHLGRLTTLPDHAGTAFVPRKRFAAGETVSVQAWLTSSAAGTAEGAPGSKRLGFSFTVASPPPNSTTVKNPPSGSNGPSRSTSPRPGSPPRFHSQPGLDPAPVHVSTRPAPGSADIFLSPISGQSGLMIVNRRGALLWFDPGHGLVPFNLEVQTYRGRPVLTWWQGQVFENHGIDGQDVILNRSYRPVAVLHGGWGYSSDLHEFQLTPQGTALIDDFVPVRANLSSVGGATDGTVFDCVIQELDVKSGRVLWEWHALGHVPLTDSYAKASPSAPYDYFHLNSIQQLPGHRLLISSPNTHAVYLIDQPTGRVIWTLGGKHPSFKMGPGTGFELQHDAHLQGKGLVTLFDDGQVPVERQSSAKELQIDTKSRTVSLIRAYRHSPPLLSHDEGGAQLLSNGDMFIGWGNEPYFSQDTPSGRQIFDASFPVGTTSYRAYRFPWTGWPQTRPAMALSRSSKGVTWAYVSWNGATRVARWRVLGGGAGNALRPLKTKRWTGFETSIALPNAPHYLAVQALDAHGRPLGRSRTMPRPPG